VGAVHRGAAGARVGHHPGLALLVGRSFGLGAFFDACAARRIATIIGRNPDVVLSGREIRLGAGRISGTSEHSWIGCSSPGHPEIWTRIPLAHLQEDSEMTFTNQSFRQAANSPTGREAAETVKSIGENVSDFAGDVGRMASKQYDRAQDVAVDALDETYAAMKRNPLVTLAIALGIGFLFGVLAGVRR